MITKKSALGMSAWTFLLPLIIASAVIAVVVINAQQKQQTVSQASYSGLERCTKECNSTSPQVAKYIKNKGKCALDCPKVMNGSLTCNDFCSQNIRSEGQGRVAGLCIARCKLWIRRDEGQEVEATTGASGATGPTTGAGFNCSDKCSRFHGAIQSQCISTCNAFNVGTRTCPSGCSFDDPLTTAACHRLFCPTRVP